MDSWKLSCSFLPLTHWRELGLGCLNSCLALFGKDSLAGICSWMSQNLPGTFFHELLDWWLDFDLFKFAWNFLSRASWLMIGLGFPQMCLELFVTSILTSVWTWIFSNVPGTFCHELLDWQLDLDFLKCAWNFLSRASWLVFGLGFPQMCLELFVTESFCETLN